MTMNPPPLKKPQKSETEDYECDNDGKPIAKEDEGKYQVVFSYKTFRYCSEECMNDHVYG